MTSDYDLDQNPVSISILEICRMLMVKDFLSITGDLLDHQLLSDHTTLQAVGAHISQPPFLSQEMSYPDPNTPLNQDMWEQNAHFGYGHYMDGCVFPTQTLPYFSPLAANSNQVISQVSSGRISAGRPGNRDRGPFLTDEERQETARTRMIGACTRCRKHRVRVCNWKIVPHQWLILLPSVR
jgi:hypothetical protein